VFYAVIWDHTQSRKKTISTFTTHITVVVLNLALHCHPMDKALSIIFTVIIPILNPIIYTLKNQDMKSVVGKLKKRLSPSKEEQPYIN
jgi:olfactory receptor